MTQYSQGHDPYQEMVSEEIAKQSMTRSRFGFYRGIVEDIDDPRKLGRVRVRVWAIHGDGKKTSTLALPWATVAETGGGGHDYGSFVLPPVGSSVLILFEMGIQDHPVVFGTFRGAPVRDELNPQSYLSTDGTHAEEKTWLPPDGELETPSDVYDDRADSDNHPTRTIVTKTVKGHTISAEDADGREHFRVTDRAGQSLEFSSPVASDAQHGGTCDGGNKAQRGARSSFRGDALPQDAMRDRKGHFRVRDLAGQEIMLDAKHMGEKIRISSQDELRTSRQSIELRSGRGKEGITISDKAGSQIDLNPNGPASVAISDQKGNKLSFRPGATVELKSARNLDLGCAGDEVISVGGSRKATVAGVDRLDALGQLRRSVGGDASIGVLGNTLVSIGSALQVLVANAPSLGGSPAATPVSVTVEAGGITLTTKVGSARLDGTTVKLGGAGATEPLVLGNQWKQIMNDLLTAIEAISVPTAVGPSGPPINTPQFEAIRAQINAGLQLSDFVFTQKIRTP